MTDTDHELWAALMADEEVAKPAVQPIVTPLAQAPLAPTPEPAAQKFFPLTPVAPPAPPAPPVPSVPPVQPVSLPLPPFEQIFASEESTEDDELFPSTLFKEPQTNSISVPEVPDALASNIVTESGEVLKTGAIDMPLLSNTGSIPIITNTVDLIDEEAIKAAMGNETTGGIPPIRSGSVMNSAARVGVLPIRNRRSEGQSILVATISILLVALGAGLIAAYMFKLI